jgi:hypothetical protein
MAWRSRTLNMRHLDYHDPELQRHMCFPKPTSERLCEGGTLNQLSEWGVPQLRHYTCELHGPAGLISPMVASCRKRSEGTQLPLQVVGCTAPPLLPSSNLRTRRQYVLLYVPHQSEAIGEHTNAATWRLGQHLLQASSARSCLLYHSISRRLPAIVEVLI